MILRSLAITTALFFTTSAIAQQPEGERLSKIDASVKRVDEWWTHSMDEEAQQRKSQREVEAAEAVAAEATAVTWLSRMWGCPGKW